MRWFLPFILLFQMTAVADIPTLHLYSLHAQMIQNETQKDICVTAQISESTSANQTETANEQANMLFMGGGTNIIEKQAADFTPVLHFSLSSLSFDRLLYHCSTCVLLEPSSYSASFLSLTSLFKESKIFDIDTLPS